MIEVFRLGLLHHPIGYWHPARHVRNLCKNSILFDEQCMFVSIVFDERSFCDLKCVAERIECWFLKFPTLPPQIYSKCVVYLCNKSKVSSTCLFSEQQTPESVPIEYRIAKNEEKKIIQKPTKSVVEAISEFKVAKYIDRLDFTWKCK